MFVLRNGEIKPRMGIGILRLGMTYEQVQAISDDFEHDDRGLAVVLKGCDVHIWVDNETDTINQITVFGSFQGRYAEKIGIGSKLTDALAMGKTYHEDLDTYVLDDQPGMCFELGDTPEDDDWDELRAPIEYISVFLPKTKTNDIEE